MSEGLTRLHYYYLYQNAIAKLDMNHINKNKELSWKLESNADVYAAEVPGAGIGLFAKRSFRVGELVLEETPFLIVPAKSVSLEESSLAAEKIIEKLDKNSDEYRKFYSLSDKYDHSNQVKTVLGIVETNGLPLGDSDSLGNIPDSAGMYILTCRVNHSCIPNVHHQWNPNRQKQTLYCIRPIKAGDAIETSYFDCAGITLEERREKTSRKWKFVCACSKCQLHGTALTQSDQLQHRIAQLDQNIHMIAGLDPTKAIRYCNDRIKMLEQEDNCDATEIVRTYFDAFQIAMQTREMRHQALEYICKSYRYSIIARGLDAPQTLKLKALVEDPNLFWADHKPAPSFADPVDGYPDFVDAMYRYYATMQHVP